MKINTETYSEIIKYLSTQNYSAKLMVVTKNRPLILINNLIEMGHTYFGENKVQEAKQKYIDGGIINLNQVHLSLIGPLQSNKVLTALKIFDSIQSVDRIKVIDEISRYLLNTNIKTKEFFIQVNIGLESQKSGIHPKELKSFFLYAKNKSLNISGLMCIPPNDENPQKYFSEMVDLRDSLDSKLTLSMGMSNDYQIALDCGSNIIRVGSLLFND